MWPDRRTGPVVAAWGSDGDAMGTGGYQVTDSNTREDGSYNNTWLFVVVNMREGSFFKEQVGEEVTLQPPCSADRMRDSQVVESDCVATRCWAGQAR